MREDVAEVKRPQVMKLKRLSPTPERGKSEDARVDFLG